MKYGIRYKNILTLLIEEYPESKKGEKKIDKEELKDNYITKNADYALFGLIKKRAQTIKLIRIKKIWGIWETKQTGQ